MLLWFMLLIVGEGANGASPDPDVADDSRRRIGMLVIRGGVGRRGRG